MKNPYTHRLCQAFKALIEWKCDSRPPFDREKARKERDKLKDHLDEMLYKFVEWEDKNA